MAGYAPLKLRARDAEDLVVISSVLQDALTPLGDIAYLEDENSLYMVMNRFRWETGAGGPAERVHSGLRFDAVRNVGYRNIDRRNRGRFLSFLALFYEGDADGGTVTIQFAGDAAIRLEVGGLYCILSDFGEPWPAMRTPEHDVG
ncbi:MAG: DUF2948 family protein [Alphaproteobacteria bacterium]